MKFLIILTIVGVLVVPAFVFANHTPSHEGIVPPCASSDEPCTFNDLFDDESGLVKHVMDFILFIIIIPIAVISIAVAGFKMIIQSDKEKARTEAKEILIAVFIGLFVAFASWLIVKVILTTLVNEDRKDGFTSPVTYIYEHK